jgi:DNA polymerase
MDLKALEKQIKKCRKCRLYKTAKNAVPGEGDPKSKFLFVGEAPGFNEDLTGHPFCGAAGEFLDELLESISLPRADVYITNIVKHRPPGNRDPETEEIDACQEYLKAQIALIKPKIIVTLGRLSKNYFLPKSGAISQIHGKIFRKKDQIIIPLYHPAAGLHQANLKEIIKKDFQIIKKIKERIG